MSLQPQPAFTPDTSVGGAFLQASSAIALPGTLGSDSVVRVANLGPCHIAVALGSSSVTTTPSTGLVIPAGQVQYLALGTATYIAGVSCGGPSSASTVNITTGN
jgi:hypothetical protein